MKDYKNELKPFPHMLKHGTNQDYPCMAIGTYQRTYDEMLKLFSEYPYNKLLIDTAYRYENEQLVGNAIADSGYPTENVSYIGKICYSQQSGGKTVEEELKGTLKRLKINSIDFYLIHSSRYTFFVDTWREMISLKSKGLIKSIGVSNFNIDALEKLYMTTGVYPEVVQLVFNPLIEETTISKIIEYCRIHSIDIEAAMPFGGKQSNYPISDNDRKKIILSLLNDNIISVIGTCNTQHMLQNLNVLEQKNVQKESVWKNYNIS